METNATYCLKLDGCLNVFTMKNGAVASFRIIPENYYKEIIDNHGIVNLKEKDLYDAMSANQVFEGYDTLLIKCENGFERMSKKQLYKESIDMIAKEIDMKQHIDGFVLMSKIQTNCIKHLLFDLFCSSSDIPRKIKLPLFSTVDYLSCDFDPSEIPVSVSINTKGGKWLDALHTIKRPASIINNIDLCHSYMVKHLIQDSL